MPPLAIHIEGTFGKEDLFRIATGTPETIIAAALLGPLDIRDRDVIALLTDADCQKDDAVRIMREVRGLLGRSVKGKSIQAYEIRDEVGSVFLDHRRQNHRYK